MATVLADPHAKLAIKAYILVEKADNKHRLYYQPVSESRESARHP